MEQFSPLLGLSSRVMENCDGDMLIRSGKPSSGIRRQVVTGPLLMCPRDVQPSEKWRQQVMQNCFSTPHSYFWCPKSIGRHNRIASNNNQKSILKHHRVPHRSHTRSFVFYFSLSLSPSLSLGLFLSDIPISLSSGWTFVGVSRREASLEKMAWCGSIVRIKRIPHLRWKTIRQRTTFDLTIMIAAQQTLLEEQRLHDTYTQRIW